MKQFKIKVENKEGKIYLNGDHCTIKCKHDICQIANHTVGLGYSAYPNISDTGSVKGMKSQGYWKKEDKTVRAHGFIYNVSTPHVTGALDALALAIEKTPYLEKRITKTKEGEILNLVIDEEGKVLSNEEKSRNETVSKLTEIILSKI